MSTLDEVYSERNTCVALIASMAEGLDLPIGIRPDEDDPGWYILFIDLPTGQVSWHFQESEKPLFPYPLYTKAWDGHSNEQKYERVLAMCKRKD